VGGSADAKAPLLVGYYGTEATNGNQFGLNGQVLGDPVAMGNAMVKWVNSNGGAGGYPIKLVVATTPLVPTTPQDQIDQSACAKFTEDNHVFAVLSITLTTPSMYECLARKNVLYVSNTVYVPDQAYYMSHANTLFSSVPNQDRVGTSAADGFWRTGFFNDPGAKVGLVTSDHPWFKSGVKAFEAEAAKHNAKLADVSYICHTPCSTTDQSNAAQSAVLKFRSENINRVILLTLESATAFLQAAGSAGYFPKYGMHSNTVPGTLQASNPPSTFSGGAVGVGIAASLDVARAQNPPLNAQTQLCEKLMQDEGISMDAISIEIQAWMTCDTFFMLKAMVDKAGKPDYAAMRGGLESLGSSLLPANGWTAWFGPRRHDGSQSYRLTAYDNGCSCFKYTGLTEYPIPPAPGEAR
jgi:ABC-type branched-subunit amino acid transport system substrate-binding protein